MGPRKSDLFLAFTMVNVLLFAALFVHAAGREVSDRPAIAARQEMVRRLGLSDLCLFTDTRYSRHPTHADFHAAFQDHPMSLEHFPSGTVFALPAQLRKPSATGTHPIKARRGGPAGQSGTLPSADEPSSGLLAEPHAGP